MLEMNEWIKSGWNKPFRDIVWLHKCLFVSTADRRTRMITVHLVSKTRRPFPLDSGQGVIFYSPKNNEKKVLKMTLRKLMNLGSSFPMKISRGVQKMIRKLEIIRTCKIIILCRDLHDEYSKTLVTFMTQLVLLKSKTSTILPFWILKRVKQWILWWKPFLMSFDKLKVCHQLLKSVFLSYIAGPRNVNK